MFDLLLSISGIIVSTIISGVTVIATLLENDPPYHKHPVLAFLLTLLGGVVIAVVGAFVIPSIIIYRYFAG